MDDTESVRAPTAGCSAPSQHVSGDKHHAPTLLVNAVRIARETAGIWQFNRREVAPQHTE